MNDKPQDRPDPRPTPHRRARLLGLFLLGAVLFNPPLLGVFREADLVLGIPALVLYLFIAWSALIAALAVIVERRRP